MLYNPPSRLWALTFLFIMCHLNGKLKQLNISILHFKMQLLYLFRLYKKCQEVTHQEFLTSFYYKIHLFHFIT